MGDFFMHKKIDQPWQIGLAFHYFQVSHLSVDKFPRNRIEVDFDGALGVLVANIGRLRK